MVFSDRAKNARNPDLTATFGTSDNRTFAVVFDQKLRFTLLEFSLPGGQCVDCSATESGFPGNPALTQSALPNQLFGNRDPCFGNHSLSPDQFPFDLCRLMFHRVTCAIFDSRDVFGHPGGKKEEGKGNNEKLKMNNEELGMGGRLEFGVLSLE